MNVFKQSCSCKKHDFVFTTRPWCKTEVKCPECGKVTVIDPEVIVEPEIPKNLKEVDN